MSRQSDSFFVVQIEDERADDLHRGPPTTRAALAAHTFYRLVPYVSSRTFVIHGVSGSGVSESPKHINTARGMRAAIYCRVSSDPQERDGTSLETQAARCVEYARSRGYAVVERLSDTTSGFTLERRGIAALRELVCTKAVDVVVTYAVDRLSRNQNQMGVLFDEMQRHGVRLEVVSEPFEDTAIGRFILAARAFMAEVEREKIAERTKRGRLQRASEGRYVGPLPFGYVRDGTQLAAHPGQAPVVRRIFDLYLRNIGTRAIAKLLNDEGARSMTGRPWYTQTVRGILRRETYTGVLLYGDVRLPDAVPALIPRATFDAVVERMERKRGLGGGRVQTSEHLLTGVLFCGLCKGRMRGLRMRPKQTRKSGAVKQYDYRGYVCSTWRDSGTCEANYHGADDLEADVLQGLTKAGGRWRDRAVEKRLATLTRDAATVETALLRNERRRQNIIDEIAEGTMSGTLAREAIATMEAQREALQTDQRRIVSERLALEADVARSQEWPAQAQTLLDTATPLAERKRLIQHVVRRLEVMPGEREPVIVE